MNILSSPFALSNTDLSLILHINANFSFTPVFQILPNSVRVLILLSLACKEDILLQKSVDCFLEECIQPTYRFYPHKGQYRWEDCLPHSSSDECSNLHTSASDQYPDVLNPQFSGLSKQNISKYNCRIPDR